MFWNPDRLSREIQDLMASSDPAAPFFQDILSRGNWRSDPVQMGGGMLVDSGSHIMDILLWLGDSAASEVIAFTETTDGIVDGMVNCQGRLTNEIMFSITFNNIVSGGETGFYSHGRLTAFGDKGVLTADWNRIMVTEASEVWTEIEGVRNKVDISLPLITPAAGFVATILDQAPNMAPAHEAARVVALAEALGRSATERRVVQIQPATG
jgi:predicted dehydrogenase